MVELRAGLAASILLDEGERGLGAALGVARRDPRVQGKSRGIGIEAPKPRMSGRTTRYRRAKLGTRPCQASPLSALPCNSKTDCGVQRSFTCCPRNTAGLRSQRRRFLLLKLRRQISI
jgi:hypothetical protein